VGRRARGSEGAPPAAPLTRPVRLSALAALDIQQAQEWHDAREPGLGDQFLQRVDETMTRIGQTPHQHPTIIEDVRRANLRQFKYGVWYPVKVDGSVVVACLHHRQQPEIAKARALGREPLHRSGLAPERGMRRFSSPETIVRNPQDQACSGHVGS
jgi:toxin ParE1/3/4